LKGGIRMAHIVNTSNHLEGKANKLKKRHLVFSIISGLAFLAAPLSINLMSFKDRFQFGMPTFMFFGAIFVASAFVSGKYGTEYKKLASGLEGEQASIKMFEGLSSDFTVITDLEIEIEGKKSQIDSVVVSSNGVFIVEVKNIKGEIVGKADEQYIKINKVGQKGGEYSKDIYNPVKQVNTHVFRLSKLLKSNNLNIWVQGMVYFSNKESQVYFKGESTPVFSYNEDGEKQLRQYITDYRKHKISKDEQDNIIKILKNYVIK
jgi:hypothetical protein